MGQFWINLLQHLECGARGAKAQSAAGRRNSKQIAMQARNRQAQETPIIRLNGPDTESTGDSDDYFYANASPSWMNDPDSATGDQGSPGSFGGEGWQDPRIKLMPEHPDSYPQPLRPEPLPYYPDSYPESLQPEPLPYYPNGKVPSESLLTPLVNDENRPGNLAKLFDNGRQGADSVPGSAGMAGITNDNSSFPYDDKTANEYAREIHNTVQGWKDQILSDPTARAIVEGYAKIIRAPGNFLGYPQKHRTWAGDATAENCRGISWRERPRSGGMGCWIRMIKQSLHP